MRAVLGNEQRRFGGLRSSFLNHVTEILIYVSNSERWAKFRKLGRNQYVLRVGVLGWGVPVAIFFSLIQSFEYGWDTFIFRLIPALVLFPVGGIFFGLFMWKIMERKHAAAMNGELKK